MNMLELNKQKGKPDFVELERMICDLKAFLDERPDFNDIEWRENLNAILDFQASDGSFRLYDSYRIPGDARVDFIYVPTYICTAILMKAYLACADAFGQKEKSALLNALKMSCSRNLRGHGYEAQKGQIEALKIFMKAGLREYIDIHSQICPEFSEMIEKIIFDFREMESQEKFKGPWGESYEEEIRQINEYFSTRKVFVYGTLMKDETNHGYLEDSEYLGKATIKGYDMYDVGWYPAIIPGDSLIIGELYNVSLKDIPSIDMLEWEGSLYAKRCETVESDGKDVLAFVYVYLGDVKGLERISSWGEEYLWYASYGSNMLKERFMCYIEGGSFAGSRSHPPCEDTTPPLAVRTIEIPYGMYFGNSSDSWHGSAVSFLDVSKAGKAFGVAYLISKRQFEHVCRRENCGREPQEGYGWYENVIDLEVMDGFEVKTLTNSHLRPYNEPSFEYLNTLFKAITQNWPDMDDEDINDYLNSCMR